VLVNVGGKGASVVAFDKGTGDVLWKSGDDPASYSSPILIEGGQRQAVFLTQQTLLSLNPPDRSVWWNVPLQDELLGSSTTPVRVGDLLVASTITYGSTALRLQSSDDKPAVKPVWKNDELTCYFATPVPVGKDYLYMVTGTKPPALIPQATLRCI